MGMILFVVIVVVLVTAIALAGSAAINAMCEYKEKKS
jgi:hypothetical protein